MKIISLQVENIASLKGKHSIDFENLQGHSGVFAITGETGSGKSTILNCISLALYGQHYRKSNKQLDFITLGEGYGEIELIYQLKNQNYKAHWFFRLKKSDGTYLKKPTPERSYYHNDAGKWVAIKESPEEVLKLTFDQFTKTIILNQGEFAKFLTSSFKDRKDILAKLYNGEKLDHLSQNVRIKINHIKQEIDQYLAQVQGINENTNFDLDEAKLILSQDQKEELNIKFITNILNENRSYIKDLVNTYQTWVKNKGNYKTSEITLSELTKKLNENKVNLSSLDKDLKEAKKVYEIQKPILIDCISKLDSIKQTQNIIFDLNKSNEQNETQLKIDYDLVSDLDTQDHELRESKSKIKESKYLIDVSKELSDQFTTEMNDAIQAFNDQKVLLAKVNLLSKNLNELQEKGEALSNLVDEGNISFTVEELNKRKDDLIKIEIETKEYEKAISSLELYFKNQSSIKKDTERNEKLLNSTNKEIQEINKQIKELTLNLSEIELALKSFKLQEMLNTISHESLTVGECLVCRSNDLSNISTIDLKDEELEHLKGRFEDKSHNKQELVLKVESLRSSQAHYRSLLTDIKHKMLENEGSLLASHKIIHKDKLQVDLLNYIDNLKEKLEKLTSKKKDQEIKLVSFQKSYDLNENNNKLLKELRGEYTKKQKELTDLNSLTADLAQKLKFFSNYIDQFSKRELEFSELSKYLQSSIEFINLKEKIKTISTQRDSTLKRIEKTKENIKNTLKKIKDNNKLIAEFKGHVKKNTRTENPQKELEDLSDKLELKQKLHDKQKNDYNEIKVSIAEQESKLKNYNEQVEQTEHLFKTISHELFIKTHQLLDKVHHLKIKDHDLFTKCKNYLEKFKTQLLINQVNIDVLTETFNYNQDTENSFKDYLSSLTTTIVKTKTLIDQKINAQKKVNEINEIVNKLKNRQHDLEDLYTLVGKDEFRNFVLALIEKNLINQTNHELKNLCDDRYLIQHFNKNAKSSPDFYVIDKFKAGLTRKVSTLSGGETFMVSLAMAMALAELTRGSSEVDSFFIDEGFGTLDEESLEDVLDMIHSMEQRGKSIGIISHVKKLTNRIGVTIKLQKSSLGNSTISVEYH